jgi:hypothetical protein
MGSSATTHAPASTAPRPDHGPAASEASARLAPLTSGQRHQVRRATRGHVCLDDAVLAAATVAVARRSLKHLRWTAIGTGVFAVGLVLVLVLAADMGTGVALGLGALVVVGLGVRVALEVRLYRKGEHRHVDVLARHGQVPAPGPSHDEQADEQGRSDARKRLLVAAAGLVVLVGWTAWVSYEDRQVAAGLAAEGERTAAEVVGFDFSRSFAELIVGDRYEVRYDVEGETIETEVLQSADVDADEGDAVEVVYDPQAPATARLSADLFGRANHVFWALGIAAVVAVVALGIQWWRRRGSQGARAGTSAA